MSAIISTTIRPVTLTELEDILLRQLGSEDAHPSWLKRAFGVSRLSHLKVRRFGIGPGKCLIVRRSAFRGVCVGSRAGHVFVYAGVAPSKRALLLMGLASASGLIPGLLWVLFMHAHNSNLVAAVARLLREPLQELQGSKGSKSHLAMDVEQPACRQSWTGVLTGLGVAMVILSCVSLFIIGGESSVPPSIDPMQILSDKLVGPWEVDQEYQSRDLPILMKLVLRRLPKITWEFKEDGTVVTRRAGAQDSDDSFDGRHGHWTPKPVLDGEYRFQVNWNDHAGVPTTFTLLDDHTIIKRCGSGDIQKKLNRIGESDG